MRTQSTDLRLIKELFGRVRSIKEDTPIIKFIEVYERYNQEIEKRYQDVTLTALPATLIPSFLSKPVHLPVSLCKMQDSLLLLLPCLSAFIGKGQSLTGRYTKALVSALKKSGAGREARMDTVIEYTILRDTRYGADTPGIPWRRHPYPRIVKRREGGMESSRLCIGILYNYDNPNWSVPASQAQLKNISRRYAGNHLIREFTGRMESFPGGT